MHAVGPLAAAALAASALTPAAAAAAPPPQPLITIGTGSSVQAATWQVCGSTTPAGVGVAASVNSPTIVSGNCNNANVALLRPAQPGLISILDNSSVNVAPWQVCGSTAVAGVGAAVAVSSPHLVKGDCNNANTFVAQDPDHAASLVSVLSGSVINAAAWQACGTTTPMGVGVAVASGSPSVVTGSCRNAGVQPPATPHKAVLPVLSGAPLNLLPLQVCGPAGVAGLAGLAVPLQSPGGVGECTSPTEFPQDVLPY